MANLLELDQWEAGIYQLETTDPVLGGPNGVDNVQGKQLANRTLHLKNQLLLKAPLDSPVFTGAPTAPTPAPGDNSLKLSNTAFVQAAITALINSSPAALDTLNELATALGNDPNFAATITNALALKAPLDSPALTGAPTAPTPAPGTNTTQIATTEFVQAAIDGGDHKDSVRVATTANIALNGEQAIDGVAVVAGDRVLVMAQAAAAENGIYVAAAGAWARAEDANSDGDLTSGVLVPVESGTDNADTVWMLTTDGAITIGVTSLTWQIKSGDASTTRKGQVQLATSAEVLAGTDALKAVTAAGLLAGLLGQGGASSYDYVTIPFRDKTTGVRRNLIVQWGTADAVNPQQTITFPIAFPTLCALAVSSDAENASAAVKAIGVVATTTQLTLTANASPGGTVYWLALGY